MSLVLESDGRTVQVMAHHAPPLAVSESEAEALREMTRAGRTEERTATDGAAQGEIARELGVSVPTVLLWRRRLHPPPGEAGRDQRLDRRPGLAGRPTQASSPTGPRRSSSAAISSSRPRWPTSSGCISPRRSGRSFYRSTSYLRLRLGASTIRALPPLGLNVLTWPSAQRTS